MSKIKRYISKKTEKIRYNFVLFTVKYLTPDFYRRIEIFQQSDTIRPSINFIKYKFIGYSLIGAEIGVSRGLNSENILEELDIETLYLIDIWKDYNVHTTVYSKYNYDVVKRKFKNDKRAIIIKGSSKKVAIDFKDYLLDFVYIDANHDFEYVYQDITLWYPKVRVGGVVAGHDIDYPSVRKAVEKFCSEKNIKFKIEVPDWWFIKQKELS